MRKYIGFALSIAVIVGLGFAQLGRAENPAVGQPERIIPFTIAVTAGTPALICTAVTGIVHNIRGGIVTNTASGLVSFRDTSSSAVGTNFMGIYGVLANTPLQFDESRVGGGLCTVKGNGIYIDGATGTISGTIRVREDPIGPR